MEQHHAHSPLHSMATLTLLGLLTIGVSGCGGDNDRNSSVNSSSSDSSSSASSNVNSSSSASSNVNSSSSDSSSSDSSSSASSDAATQTHRVSATAGDNGGISPASVTVKHGADTEFTLTPDSGYGIASVTGCDGRLNGNTYTSGEITAACTVEASFYELTPPSAPTLSLTPAAVKRFQFSWEDIENETEYKLLEDPTGDSGYTEIARLDADTTDHELVISLPSRINARYILQACNSVGCNDSEPVYVNGTLEEAVGYLKASNAGTNDVFGWAVALSSDGNTLAVGAPLEGNTTTGVNSAPDDGAEGAGAVYIFTRNGGSWSEQAHIKASNRGLQDLFGVALAMSRDGDTLAVGAPDEDSDTTGINSSPNDNGDDNGAVYVFTRSGETWSETAYLKASNTSSYDHFGEAVALSPEGDTLAVGAPDRDIRTTEADSIAKKNAGSVYIFTLGSETWSEQAYLTASNAGAYDQFGTSVALSELGNTLAVGAYREDSSTTGIDTTPNDEATDAGAVYIFGRSGNNWSEQTYIKASNSGRDDHFGFAVALSDDGNTLAAGSYYEESSTTGVGSTPNDDAPATGAVYVFSRSDDIWSEQAYIKASNAERRDYFGVSVELSGDGNTLAVGAPEEKSSTTGVGSEANNNAPRAGAAYLFTRRADTWSEQAYLKASNTEQDSYFGVSVALSFDGKTLAVGADGESGTTGVGSEPDESATNSGAVYLY